MPSQPAQTGSAAAKADAIHGNESPRGSDKHLGRVFGHDGMRLRTVVLRTRLAVGAFSGSRSADASQGIVAGVPEWAAPYALQGETMVAQGAR